MRTVVVEPRKLSFDRIISIYKLIEWGGQIKLAPSVLLKQIVSSQLIAFAKSDVDTTYAIAVIKVPQESYVQKVFSHAGFSGEEHESTHKAYGYELGYCVTDEEYKGQGVCKELVIKLLQNTSVARLFATTASGAMAHILTKNGFKKTGNTHVTEDNRKIDLYTYEL